MAVTILPKICPYYKFKNSYIYPFGWKTKEEDPVSNFVANRSRSTAMSTIFAGISMHSVVFDDKFASNIVQLGMF